jgi:CHAT domain
VKGSCRCAGRSALPGRRRVLASHWKVSDKATSQLMTEFMRRGEAGEPRAKAWREAQLAVGCCAAMAVGNIQHPTANSQHPMCPKAGLPNVYRTKTLATSTSHCRCVISALPQRIQRPRHPRIRVLSSWRKALRRSN